MEKVYKLHPHAPQPLILLLPNKNFVNGHLLASSHLDQTWAASFQKLEVSHCNGGVKFKGDLAFQVGGGFGGLGGWFGFTPAMSLGG